MASLFRWKSGWNQEFVYNISRLFILCFQAIMGKCTATARKCSCFSAWWGSNWGPPQSPRHHNAEFQQSPHDAESLVSVVLAIQVQLTSCKGKVELGTQFCITRLFMVPSLRQIICNLLSEKRLLFIVHFDWNNSCCLCNEAGLPRSQSGGIRNSILHHKSIYAPESSSDH